jgi:hypothetical protein
MIITIMKSLGEALLVDKIISQIKSPDANCEGRFILYKSLTTKDTKSTKVEGKAQHEDFF